MEPTDDWEQLELLCTWEEQREYERIRPLVLFGEPVPERSGETGLSERTLYRRIASFEEVGMESLFGSEPAKRRVLPRSVRRLIVDLKAEHPALNLNEIAVICYVSTGRKPHLATVRSVLDEEPLPIKAFKRFEPYHEIAEGRERRKAVVALHYEGWANKSIARYLKVDRSTVRRVCEQACDVHVPDKNFPRPAVDHAFAEMRAYEVSIRGWVSADSIQSFRSRRSIPRGLPDRRDGRPAAGSPARPAAGSPARYRPYRPWGLNRPTPRKAPFQYPTAAAWPLPLKEKLAL